MSRCTSTPSGTTAMRHRSTPHDTRTSATARDTAMMPAEREYFQRVPGLSRSRKSTRREMTSFARVPVIASAPSVTSCPVCACTMSKSKRRMARRVR